MKSIYSIILFVLLSLPSYSQGFNWQYDMRMPFEIPSYFINLSVNGGLINHSGEFGFIEKNITCCTFESGSGTNYALNIGGEYWYNGNTALIANIGFESVGGKFTKQNESPRTDDYILITEFEYNNTLNLINIDIGGKYRIMKSHFFAGGYISPKFLISEDHNFKEKKISPMTDPFTDREIPTASVEDLNMLLMNINLIAGYDFNMGKGKYFSVYMKFNQQILSYLSNESWYTNSVNIGFKFNKGIFINN